MDDVADADGYDYQDIRGVAFGEDSQEARDKLHCADVLLHMQGGKPGGGILYAAQGRQVFEI